MHSQKIVWLWLVLAYSTLVLGQLPRVQDDMAVVGVNHVLDLSRDMFFNKTSAGAGDAIRYIASKVGRPDLPSWLHLIQHDYTQPGYLYGTPSSPDDSVNLQLLAVNKNTQQVSQRKVQINVNKQSDEPQYFVDFTILNHNLGDKPVKAMLNEILVRVRRIWMNSGHIYVTKVLTLKEVGERLPVPEDPGDVLIKEGVLVQIGGTNDFSPSLKSVEREINSRCLEDSQPTVSIDNRFRPEFVIDWCKYRLITREMLAPAVAPEVAPRPVLQGQDFDMSTSNIPRRYFLTDFIITVILPIIVTIILAIILSILFFGGREGVESRDDTTSETQMFQFNTIRRATTNLRLMSHHRDGPPPLSASTPVRDRYSSLPSSPSHNYQPANVPRGSSTLPRSQPPPPYRLPPHYPTSRQPPVMRDPSPSHFDGDRGNENQRLVGQSSPGHVGNDNLAQQ